LKARTVEDVYTKVQKRKDGWGAIEYIKGKYDVLRDEISVRDFFANAWQNQWQLHSGRVAAPFTRSDTCCLVATDMWQTEAENWPFVFGSEGDQPQQSLVVIHTADSTVDL